MKKLLTISATLFFLLAVAPHAFAQSVAPGGACTQDSDCQDVSGQSYGCFPEGKGICTLDGDAPADGTIQPGGACTNDDSCADVNGQSYGCYQGACTLNGDASTGVNGGNTNASTGFVPLAPIPGLDDAQSGANASSLAQFLQNLYKYLIGIAAVLAVIEIIVGGLQYATQDSISKKGEGRERIEHALLGLVLVLSPALVFSIINPSILNLSLNLPALNTASGTATAGTGATGGTGGATTGSTQGTSAGCNTPTGGTAYQSVGCTTNDAATNWNTLFCGGEGNLQGGSCKSGGVNSDGSCADGTLNWTVFCPGTSSQSWQLYTESIPGFWSSFSPTSNITWRPVPSDLSAVEGYVSACSSGYVCLPGGIGDTISAIWTNSTKPVCPTGQQYTKFSSDGSNPQPYCISTQIRCTDSAHTGCLGGTILDASPQ